MAFRLEPIEKKKSRFRLEPVKKEKSRFRLEPLQPSPETLPVRKEKLSYLDLISQRLAKQQAKKKEYFRTQPFWKELLKYGVGPMFRPITTELGLAEKPPEEWIRETPLLKRRPERFAPAFTREIARGITGQAAKIATTPASYLVAPIARGLTANIPAQTFIRKYLPTLGKGLIQPVTPDEIAYQNWLRKPVISPSAQELIQRQVGNPMRRVIDALRAARPLRKEQEALYTTAREKLTAKISEIGRKVPGERGFYSQLKALKGPLPKVQFEPIRNKITQTDIDSIFNMVEQNSSLLPFEKITAKTGLIKLLGFEGGAIPTKGEINLLQDVFPKEFISTILFKRTLFQKAGVVSAEVLNIPRAIMASTDMSAPLRQGAFLVGRPRQFFPAFKEMFKYFFSEKAYKGLIEDIKRRPTYFLMKKSKLPLTEIGAKLTGREEAFMSSYAEKIPFAGIIVRASNRAYTGFLNKLRADVFDDLVTSARKLGLNVSGKLARDISSFVGSATGRGILPKSIEGSAVALNTILFSPRLMFSRLHLLNPVYYIKLNPFVRKEALKSLFTFSGAAATVLSLGKLGGAKIGTDPRSADFGKMKIGKTRYDFLAGFQQYIRLGAQLITGEHVSSTTGVRTTIGEGYKPLTRLEILQRFLESKEAPIASFATSLLRGRTRLGEDIILPKEIGLRFTPMVIQDMYDLSKERGMGGVGMAIPAIFGVGVQTYAPTAEDIVRSTRSVERNLNELTKQGRIREARSLYLENRKLIKKGKILEPLQKEIDEYERAKDRLIKNVRYTTEQKRKFGLWIDKKMKKMKNVMDKKYKRLK